MFVDVAFGISGGSSRHIPADHGYLLYGAVTSVVPALHGSSGDGPAYAIHPIRGQKQHGRELELLPESHLTIRISHEHVRLLLPLAGKTVRLGATSLRIGVPAVHSLVPAPILQTHLAIIKGFVEPVGFLESVKRQLAAAAIDATAQLLAHSTEGRFERRTSGSDGPVRRTLRVRDKEIVGFAVRVSGLGPDASLALQASGIGGRQHFGCGVLNPLGGVFADTVSPVWQPSEGTFP